MGRLTPCNCRISSLAVVRCWTPIVFIQLGNYWFGLSWKCRLAPKLQVFGFSGVWVFITCWWVSSEAEKCVTSVINSCKRRWMDKQKKASWGSSLMWLRSQVQDLLFLPVQNAYMKGKTFHVLYSNICPWTKYKATLMFYIVLSFSLLCPGLFLHKFCKSKK